MPELPDLTVVAEQLADRVTGRTIVEASAPTPILVRATPEELAALAGCTLGAASRRGKFLLLPFERDGAPTRILAANPMLAGRFWITAHRDRVRARTGLRLADGSVLVVFPRAIAAWLSPTGAYYRFFDLARGKGDAMRKR